MSPASGLDLTSFPQVSSGSGDVNVTSIKAIKRHRAGTCDLTRVSHTLMQLRGQLQGQQLRTGEALMTDLAFL